MGDFLVHHVRFFEYQPKAVHSIAYNKENKKVALSRSDASIEIWSVADSWYQEKVIRNTEEIAIEDVCWQGNRLFAASLNGEVIEYDLLRLQPKQLASSNAGPIWCLCSSPNNDLLAAGTEEGCVVLFDTSGDGVEYLRCFDKQEGRILSIAWHKNGDIVVTGGIDNIRLWSVKSGHAIQRIIPGRNEKQKETLVWCLAVLSDMTIVSGDSRGKTCFWNGEQGTLIKGFQSHKADVFCLCVDPNEESVFTSGVHQLVAQFQYTCTRANSDWKSWVAVWSHGHHTHEVRALAVVDGYVVSGGVDTNLIAKKIQVKPGEKGWFQLSPLIQQSLVKVAKEAGILGLQYHTYLEVWQLGQTNRTTGKHGEILPTDTEPIKLLQLQNKPGVPISCFAISNNGDMIALSDATSVRLYQLEVTDSAYGAHKVALKRVKLTSAHSERLMPAHKMEFTPEGTALVMATSSGQLQVVSLDNHTVTDVHTIPSVHSNPHSITHLCVSPAGNMAAVADTDRRVVVYDVINGQGLCQLPRNSCQACALNFSAEGDQLVVAYTDQTVREFDIPQCGFTEWSKTCATRFPHQWRSRKSKIRHVATQSNHPERILIVDERMLCVLNKNQRFPSGSEDLYSNCKPKSKGKKKGDDHAFHICGKYKYIMHADILKDDWLVVVERPPLSIMENLPHALKLKKFGT